MLPGRCVIRVQIDPLWQILHLRSLAEPSLLLFLVSSTQINMPDLRSEERQTDITKSPEHKRGIDAFREISSDAIALFTSKGARHAQFRGLTATGRLVD